jgi:predicted SAM-dependent methyltransferase
MNRFQNEKSPKLLNLACGAKVSKVGNWVNVDYASPLDNVLKMNILDGLNFSDNSFDVVYTAQFIEHLTLKEAEKILHEIHRVLKPGGVLRIVTPDLEELSRSYLQYLDKLKNEFNADDEKKYEWIRIELFDQIVRDYSGGEMNKFVKKCDENMKKYLLERIGYTFSTFSQPTKNNKKYTSLTDLLNIIPRVGKKIVRTILENVVSKSSRIGRFRQSGEVHRYMHDVYSLTHLLESQGFSSITKIDPYTSAISDWDKYELDVINGQPDGPFALYVEAKV